MHSEERGLPRLDIIFESAASSDEIPVESVIRRVKLIDYVEVIVFMILLGIAASVFDFSGTTMATMTNTFATISGVFLGLYLVMMPNPDSRNHTITQLLFFSIITSIISSLISYGEVSGTPEFLGATSRVIFVVSALAFGFSTAYFVIGTRLLGPIRPVAREKP